MKIIITSLAVLITIIGQAQTFTLRSNNLTGQATDSIYSNHSGCTGKNISPHLNWSNAPDNTKSFAITMYDPDAPTGSGWWHWVVFNIPSGVTEIVSNASQNKDLLPNGTIESITDFGSFGFGGPCPPEGDKPHMYVLTIYALNTEKLGLNKNANPATVGFYLNASAIAKASIIFYAQR